MNTFNGMKIVVSQYIVPVPKLQLSIDFNECSPEFKADMNAWLLEKFGTYLPTYVIGNHTIVMHPKHLEQLKNATR